MSKSKDKLYVFVKGNKGIGAFLITGPDFKEIYKNIIKNEDSDPYYMDLHAMEVCLDYIVKNRGEESIPEQPVVCIYTTYETNYEVMSTAKMPNEKNIKMKEIKVKLDNLQETINQNRVQKDGVKYYWVPKEFEMHHFKNLDKLLLEHKNSKTKFKL